MISVLEFRQVCAYLGQHGIHFAIDIVVSFHQDPGWLLSLVSRIAIFRTYAGQMLGVAFTSISCEVLAHLNGLAFSL